MRIAVRVIALCLTIVVGFQSFVICVGGSLTDQKDTASGGAVGILIAFLFVLGAAFSVKLPKFSMI